MGGGDVDVDVDVDVDRRDVVVFVVFTVAFVAVVVAFTESEATAVERASIAAGDVLRVDGVTVEEEEEAVEGIQWWLR